MSVGVMKDYKLKLRKLRTSHTLLGDLLGLKCCKNEMFPKTENGKRVVKSHRNVSSSLKQERFTRHSGDRD